MQRRQFFIEDTDYEKIEGLAEREGGSVAEQVRSAIAFWLAVRHQDQAPDAAIQTLLAGLDRSDAFWLQVETLKQYYAAREGAEVNLLQIIVDSIDLRYKEIRDGQNNRARITHVVQNQVELKEGQAQIVAGQAQVEERLTRVETQLAQAVELLAELALRNREGEGNEYDPTTD